MRGFGVAVWLTVCLAACGRTELFPARPGGDARALPTDAGRDAGPGDAGGAHDVVATDGATADGAGDFAPGGSPFDALSDRADASVPLDVTIRLSASTDRVDGVQLIWQLSGGSLTGLLLQRDGRDLAVVGPFESAFLDAGTGAGSVTAPLSLSATAGTRTTGVLVTWSPPSALAGERHTYQVFALSGDARVGTSNLAMGARAAPGVSGYQLTRDDGANWQAAGAGPSFEDLAAPLGALQASVEALPRYPRNYVRLRVLAEPTFMTVPATYRVRAVTAAGAGPWSVPATGYRGRGDTIAYSWQRSAADSDADYTELPGVTGAIWFDGEAPVGVARTYRAVLRADGAEGITQGVRADMVRFRRLSGGSFRTCGLRTDGRVLCWGRPFRDFASDTPSSDTFKEINGGVFAGCGVRTDDKVVCWGRPNYYETPPKTPTDESFKSVGIGIENGCGLLLDGTLICWGGNAFTPPVGTFKSLSMGGAHACAIRSDDRVLCWGNNTAGEAPPEPSADTFKIVHSAWGRHTCGIRSDDRLVCWGDDSSGQSPPGPSIDTFMAVAGGAAHTCALRTDGRLLCWGDGTLGQAPPGPSEETYTDVTAGYRHTCGLRSDGRVVCFGDDSSGQLPYVPPSGTFRAVSVGSTLGNPFVCGLRTDGKQICWGDNEQGQAPQGPSQETFQSVSTGYYTSCFLRPNGQADCQGLDYDAPGPHPATTEALSSVAAGFPFSCGVRASDMGLSCWTGDSGFASPTPEPPSGRFTNLAVGDGHACGVRDDSKVLCWGTNVYGQAPPGPSTASFSTVSAGEYQTCGLHLDGTVDCWGGYIVRFRAVPPLPQDRFQSLSAGYESFCGVRQDRRVLCWAAYPNSPLFVDAPSLDQFKSVSTGDGTLCALRDDERLLCWGGSRGL